jgi:hypothetical protein
MKLSPLLRVSSGGSKKNTPQCTAKCQQGCLNLLHPQGTLRQDEISIHWAWKLRKESPEDQLDAIGRFRFEKGLMTEIRQRAIRRRKRGMSAPPKANEVVSRLNKLGREALAAVGVTILKSPGIGILSQKHWPE